MDRYTITLKPKYISDIVGVLLSVFSIGDCIEKKSTTVGFNFVVKLAFKYLFISLNESFSERFVIIIKNSFILKIQSHMTIILGFEAILHLHFYVYFIINSFCKIKFDLICIHRRNEKHVHKNHMVEYTYIQV